MIDEKREGERIVGPARMSNKATKRKRSRRSGAGRGGGGFPKKPAGGGRGFSTKPPRKDVLLDAEATTSLYLECGDPGTTTTTTTGVGMETGTGTADEEEAVPPELDHELKKIMAKYLPQLCSQSTLAEQPHASARTPCRQRGRFSKTSKPTTARRLEVEVIEEEVTGCSGSSFYGDGRGCHQRHRQRARCVCRHQRRRGDVHGCRPPPHLGGGRGGGGPRWRGHCCEKGVQVDEQDEVSSGERRLAAESSLVVLKPCTSQFDRTSRENSTHSDKVSLEEDFNFHLLENTYTSECELDYCNCPYNRKNKRKKFF